jgi:hypothetical protein
MFCYKFISKFGKPETFQRGKGPGGRSVKAASAALGGKLQSLCESIEIGSATFE